MVMQTLRDLPLFNISATYRFVVLIDNFPLGAFTECVLPTLTIETEDIKEGGLNTRIHKLPTRTNAGTLKLKRGVSTGDLLFRWFLLVQEGEWDFAKRTVRVISLNSMSTSFVQYWKFDDAYPIKWTGPSMRAGEAAIAIQELEIAHAGFTVE
jgi:phage tail-like protein